MTNNQVLSSASRQARLCTAMRFDGADVPAAPVAGAGVYLDMPPNHIVLSTSICSITLETGAAATYDVGTVADDDGYFTDVVVGTTGALGLVTETGNALNGILQTEATEIHVSQGSGAFVGDGDFVLIIEYITLGKTDEVYGGDT